MNKQLQSVKDGHAAFVIPFWSDGKPDRRRFLDSAIESVFMQTDKRWRIYITDDYSPYMPDRDYLSQMESKYPDIRVTFSDTNTGPGAARNKSIRRAYEDGCAFICYMDSDDISSKYRAEEVREIFLKDPEAQVIYSTFDVIDEENCRVPEDRLIEGIRIMQNDMERAPLEGYDIWIDIAIERDNLTIPSALNVKTGLACNFPFPEEVRFHEDTHTWLRYSASGAKIVYSPKIPTLYRVPQKLGGSASRDRAGGIEAFNRLRCEVIMKGLDEAVRLAQKRKVIQQEKAVEIKTRFLLNVASMIRKEGTIHIAKELVMQAQSLSSKHFELFKSKYDLTGLL